MTNYHPTSLFVPTKIADAVNSLCSNPDALEALEQEANANNLVGLPLIVTDEWKSFSANVYQIFTDRDYLVLKGLYAYAHGATLLLAARTVGTNFRTYRGGQIVKHFKMTPWTKDLSHTTREGEFHTDINTESCPPAITAMQCLETDPGAPQYGLNRVARLEDILAFLEESKDKETLKFLTNETVSMLNDRSSSSWSGHIVEKDVIRYHPETLRAAAHRYGYSDSILEEKIAKVANASLAVSEPFVLEKGDILLLSNYRTLHYRGECSVVFKHYPTEFVSRSIFVLHMTQEIKAS